MLLTTTFADQQLYEVNCDLNVIYRCHFDPQEVPEDGILSRDQFTWMAVLEYLDLHTGMRFEDRIPRVSLIHQQFALTTASVASNVPDGYALGNVIIVEYERNEQSCGLTIHDALAGKQCARASYVVPIVDVIVHPEYAAFDAPDSLAIIKMLRPIESTYFMAVCLPLGPAWTYEMKVDRVFLLDFVSAKLEDYEHERKAIKKIHILTQSACGSYLDTQNVSSIWRSRILCTTGCSMRPGSALVTHDRYMRLGHYWHLTGIAIGGPACSEPADRHRRNASPARFIYVWPYVEWIKEVLMSHLNPFPIPAQFRKHKGIPGSAFEDVSYMEQRDYTKRWEGRWYTEGTRCRSIRAEPLLMLVYEDYFSVRTMVKSWLRFTLNLRSDLRYNIQCMKVSMPNHFHVPDVVQTPYNCSVTIPLARFPRRYDVRVQAYAIAETNETIINDREKWMSALKKQLDSAPAAMP